MLLIPLRLGLTDINEAYVGTLKVGLRRAHTALPDPLRVLPCAKAFLLPQPSDRPVHPDLHLGTLAALPLAPCPRACSSPALRPLAACLHSSRPGRAQLPRVHLLRPGCHGAHIRPALPNEAFGGHVPCSLGARGGSPSSLWAWPSSTLVSLCSVATSPCPPPQHCFMMPQSLGVIGGKPNSAHYFIGYVGEYPVPVVAPLGREDGAVTALPPPPPQRRTHGLTSCPTRQSPPPAWLIQATGLGGAGVEQAPYPPPVC